MKRIEAIIRKTRFEDVKEALRQRERYANRKSMKQEDSRTEN